MVDEKLYSHQKEAIDKLRSGSILCGGVGSGKSRTAIAYFLKKELKASSGKLYIITTAMKRDSLEWDGELGIFGISKHSDVGRDDVEVVIDSWNNIEKYVSVRNSFFIFDEQRVIGKGLWAKAFCKIAKSNRWILLSATPGDTWSDYIPVFVANGFFKNRTEFLKKHVVFSRFSRYPKIERYIYTDKLEELRKQILVEMPMKRDTITIDKNVYSEYDTKMYQMVVNRRWNFEEDRPIVDAAEQCRLLRKIVNSDKSKIDELDKIYKEHSKAIVYYNFNYELDMLKEYCESHDVVYGEYNGHKHDKVPEYKEWMYLVQYSAGSEGWNCIETNTIIFFSLNYSYKIMAQARGRIDRLNTPYHRLYYYSIVSRSSIDYQIQNAILKKKVFNEKAFVAMMQN